MTLRSALLLGTVLLSACTAPVMKSAAPVLASVVGGLAGTPSSPTTRPVANAQQIWVTLPSRGVKFAMAELENRNGTVVFAAQDGSQVFLKSGVLVGTRGFGRDLMSASSIDLATLQKGAEHQRSYYDMDGTDTMIRHDFTCKAEKPAAAAATADLAEACASQIGTIRNEFWVKSGKFALKSKQWVSQGVGYAIIEVKTE